MHPGIVPDEVRRLPGAGLGHGFAKNVGHVRSIGLMRLCGTMSFVKSHHFSSSGERTCNGSFRVARRPFIFSCHHLSSFVVICRHFNRPAIGTVILLPVATQINENAVIPGVSRARDPQGSRSEERRVGQECVRTCRSRWSPSHSNKTRTISMQCEETTDENNDTETN